MPLPARPATSVSHWADGGLVVEPADSYKTTGWLAAVKPPAQFMNWIHNAVFRWLGYFDGRRNTALTGDGYDGACGITGTVTVTAGSTTVTGQGTGFASWMVGCTFIASYTAQTATISAVDAVGQTLTLSAGWAGLSGASTPWGIQLPGDKNFDTISIDAGNAIHTALFKLRYATSCNLNGSINCDGARGGDAVAATSVGAGGNSNLTGSLLGGSAGTSGAATALASIHAAFVPTNTANSLGGNGGGGGSWNGPAIATPPLATPRGVVPQTTGHLLSAGAVAGITGGAGGIGGYAQGNGSATGYAGGGGEGGGHVLLAGRTLTVATTALAGTVAGNATQTITGTGTNFLALMPGAVVTFSGQTGVYEITAIASATSMTVHKATGTFTGATCSVVGALTARGGNGGNGSAQTGIYGMAGCGGGGGAVQNTALSLTGSVSYVIDGGIGGYSNWDGSTAPSGAPGSYVECVL